MAYIPMFGSRKRERLWQMECLCSYKAGRGRLPICNLCGEPVAKTDPWHESHDGTPKALGGKSVGIAHAKCNLDHGAKVVTPMVAKADRVRAKHQRLKGPGLGRHPMPCGRRSRWTKTMGKGVQPRLTGAQRFAEFKARHAILFSPAGG